MMDISSQAQATTPNIPARTSRASMFPANRDFLAFDYPRFAHIYSLTFQE